MFGNSWTSNAKEHSLSFPLTPLLIPGHRLSCMCIPLMLPYFAPFSICTKLLQLLICTYIKDLILKSHSVCIVGFIFPLVIIYDYLSSAFPNICQFYEIFQEQYCFFSASNVYFYICYYCSMIMLILIAFLLKVSFLVILGIFWCSF